MGITENLIVFNQHIPSGKAYMVDFSNFKRFAEAPVRRID
jgi:hypothetical protein